MSVRTPTTRDGRSQYDGLSASDAVARAWTTPGANPEWHKKAQQEVRDAMPVLARALDRLTTE